MAILIRSVSNAPTGPAHRGRGRWWKTLLVLFFVNSLFFLKVFFDIFSDSFFCWYVGSVRRWESIETNSQPKKSRQFCDWRIDHQRTSPPSIPHPPAPPPPSGRNVFVLNRFLTTDLWLVFFFFFFVWRPIFFSVGKFIFAYLFLILFGLYFWEVWNGFREPTVKIRLWLFFVCYRFGWEALVPGFFTEFFLEQVPFGPLFETWLLGKTQ